MKKRLFVGAFAMICFAAISGGSVSAISEWLDYTPGSSQNAPTGDIDVCVYKTGGYTGGTITADIYGGGFETQLEFDSFAEDSSCVALGDVPSDTVVRYVMPMGQSGLKYGSDNETVGLNLNDSISKVSFLSMWEAVAERIAATKAEIRFDANGGEGSMSPIQNITPSTNVTLPINTITKTGCDFIGWNTKADGSGDNYDDEDTITIANGGVIILYAQWRELTYAVLDYGKTVDVKMKKMAGGTSSNYETSDTQIRAIKNADTLPVGFDENDEKYIISRNSSPEKIYAWFDNTDNDNDGKGDGIIYVFTYADGIKCIDLFSLFYSFKSLTDISALASWDTSAVIDMGRMFFENTNLSDISALASWDTSAVTDMGSMFFKNTNLSDISALASWNTSAVKNMSRMFWGDSNLSDISALASWNNTSAVKNMSYMFYQNTNLSDISALASWNTSAVTNMSHMFYGDTNLSDISALAGWDTSAVTNMSGMFYDDTNLSDISALAGWDTSAVTNMSYMFAGTAITNVDALETKQHQGKDYVSWNTSAVTDMSYMLSHNTNLSDISALAGWNTSAVTNMSYMFADTAITNVDVLETKQHQGKDYVSWDISAVTNMGGMFYKAKLSNISALASWNTSAVTDMSGMFSDNSNLSDISALASWDTSAVTNMGYGGWRGNYTGGMFAGTAITNVDALETKQHQGKEYVSWDISAVRNMSEMFYNNTNLSDISALASWNTSAVAKNMSEMFYNNTNLSDISALASWNTSTATNMSYMFYGDTNLSDISALAGWNTSAVKNMSYMFYGDTNLSDISVLASWNTSAVTNMSWMFARTAITNVDALETKQYQGKDYVSWNTSAVTNMSYMFYKNTNLSDISALASWNTSAVTNMSYMFYQNTNLSDVSALASWNTSAVTDITYMFYGVTSCLDFSVLDNWSLNPSLKKGYAFFNTSSTAILPLWY